MSVCHGSHCSRLTQKIVIINVIKFSNNIYGHEIILALLVSAIISLIMQQSTKLDEEDNLKLFSVRAFIPFNIFSYQKKLLKISYFVSWFCSTLPILECSFKILSARSHTRLNRSRSARVVYIYIHLYSYLLM